ncbi:MAG: GNAT family N-acetyltransferase [Verrucomicrobiaceae bacterium]
MWQLAEVSLRPQTDGDISFIEDLVIAVREREPGFCELAAEERTRILREQSKLQLADYGRKFPQGHFLIIEASGRAIGRFYVNHASDHIRVVELSVLPDYQGHGIGQQLMKSVLAEGTRTGVPVRLSVALGNPAFTFYETLGFRETGRGESHLRMEWKAAAIS